MRLFVFKGMQNQSQEMPTYVVISGHSQLTSLLCNSFAGAASSVSPSEPFSNKFEETKTWGTKELHELLFVPKRRERQRRRKLHLLPCKPSAGERGKTRTNNPFLPFLWLNLKFQDLHANFGQRIDLIDANYVAIDLQKCNPVSLSRNQKLSVTHVLSTNYEYFFPPHSRLRRGPVPEPLPGRQAPSVQVSHPAHNRQLGNVRHRNTGKPTGYVGFPYN